MYWADTVVESLKASELGIVAYVPDAVTWRVLSRLEDDPYFHVVPTSREDEAIGIVSGAYAAGKRGAVFMQSSGFGNCINALSSLCIPSLIPFPMFVSLSRRPRRAQRGPDPRRQGGRTHHGRPGVAALQPDP